MWNLREFKEELVEEPEIGRPVDEYFNAAFEIGLVAHLIGVELLDEIALSESQSNRAKKRMGIQTSLPRSAVAYALAQGYDTGSRVRSYFEDEPDLEPIELTLKLSKDRFGQVESYEFFDSVTGTESALLSVESLAVTVAQVKKEPKYKDRFINRIR